jgi:hypothetical protein
MASASISLLSNISDSIDFILLEEEQDPNFEKYKDIFEKSKILEEYITNSYTNYIISIKDFDTLLYEYLSQCSNIKIPVKTNSIASYIHLDISFVNDTIVFRNDIDIKDILAQLKIVIISLETNNLESEIRIIKNLYKIIKLNCSNEFVPESKRIIIKYPIMFSELETPMILAIYKETNKIIGYVNYRNIEDNSIYIEFIEVNPEYRNFNLCKRMLSFLIMQKSEIMSYELLNVGGLSGYSCYVDAFESNNFTVKLKFFDKKLKKSTLNNLRISRKTKKINITKIENIAVNRKFNGEMYFTKVLSFTKTKFYQNLTKR